VDREEKLFRLAVDQAATEHEAKAAGEKLIMALRARQYDPNQDDPRDAMILKFQEMIAWQGALLEGAAQKVEELQAQLNAQAQTAQALDPRVAPPSQAQPPAPQVRRAAPRLQTWTPQRAWGRIRRHPWGFQFGIAALTVAAAFLPLQSVISNTDLVGGIDWVLGIAGAIWWAGTAPEAKAVISH
jgi:hypothetical protein